MGRPIYSEELTNKILQRIMQGEMLTRICSEEGMPAWQTYYGWMDGRPELKEAHAHARLAWSDYWAERALTMSLDGSKDVFIDEETGKAVIDHAAVQRSRLAVDTIKWLTSKYAAKVYGDRPQDSETPASGFTIRWLANDPAPATPPPEPRRLEYKRPQLPADLSERDWQLLMTVLEKIKQRTPSDAERPPAAVLEAVAKAIDALYADCA
jgi:hypothetical protein